MLSTCTVQPSATAYPHGRPSSGRDTSATVSISAVDGASASRDAGHRSRHIAAVSSDSPARARITPTATAWDVVRHVKGCHVTQVSDKGSNCIG